MAQWIDPADTRFRLGVVVMDETHREFIDRINALGSADDGGFMLGFMKLVQHTAGHFDIEATLMAMSGYPARREHEDEHRRVLRELRRLERKVSTGYLNFARAYVTEQLPDWFTLHAVTMDSALAAHVRRID